MLQLNTQYERGEIIFLDGRVVAASRSGSERTIGEALLEAGVVPPIQFQDMLAAQARGVSQAELISNFQVDVDAWKSTVRELLSSIIYAMFDWEDGTFSFVLDQNPDPERGFSLNASRAVLSEGMNPQFLAMEGARLRDERNQGDSLSEFLAKDNPPRDEIIREDSPAFAELGLESTPSVRLPSPSVSAEEKSNLIPFPLRRDERVEELPSTVGNVATQRAPVEERGWTLLLLDDDATVLAMLEQRFRRRFDRVVALTRVEDAKAALDDLQGQYVVVSDLLVPRSDGRGILGGIELAEEVRERDLSIPFVLFTDFDTAQARQSTERLRVSSLLVKPRRGKVTRATNDARPSEAMARFLDRLEARLEPYLGEEKPESESLDLGRDFADDIGEIVASAEAELPPRAPGAEQMDMLRSMLAELVNPANRETITLLVLRFADHVVERAALFLVTRDSYIGLGGFSSLEDSDSFVMRVRKTHVPTEAGVVFDRVVKYQTLLRAPLDDTPVNRALVERLGGGWHGGEMVVAPLTSAGRVAAVLVGDNPSRRPLGPTEGLEIFLQQAGLAMDRALLERRLEESKRSRDE